MDRAEIYVKIYHFVWKSLSKGDFKAYDSHFFLGTICTSVKAKIFETLSRMKNLPNHPSRQKYFD
jgi:hypothetical protein